MLTYEMEDAHGGLTDKHDKEMNYHDDKQEDWMMLVWRGPRVQDDQGGDAKVKTQKRRPRNVQPADEGGTMARSYCT